MGFLGGGGGGGGGMGGWIDPDAVEGCAAVVVAGL